MKLFSDSPCPGGSDEQPNETHSLPWVNSWISLVWTLLERSGIMLTYNSIKYVTKAEFYYIPYLYHPKVHLKEFSAVFALKFELICTFCFLYCPTAICGIYSLNNKLRGVSLKANRLLPSLPDALNASWATAGWGARGAWWEMEASLPAAVLDHRSVVRFPWALIREPPLRKHTCRQPMRRCPAAHTGPAYTRTDANTLANSANTHAHTPSELWVGSAQSSTSWC